MKNTLASKQTASHKAMPRQAYLILILFSLIQILLASQSIGRSQIKDLVDPYILYNYEYSQKIKIPNKVNLNHASVNELSTLPKLNQSTALKIVRLRQRSPIRNLNAFYQLPFINTNEIQEIIKAIQPLVRFR